LGGLVLGAVIGGISGLVGIGGGAFLIPAPIFFYGMSQKTAAGFAAGGWLGGTVGKNVG
jgi:hypothetical protein